MADSKGYQSAEDVIAELKSVLPYRNAAEAVPDMRFLLRSFYDRGFTFRWYVGKKLVFRRAAGIQGLYGVCTEPECPKMNEPFWVNTNSLTFWGEGLPASVIFHCPHCCRPVPTDGCDERLWEVKE